MLSGAHKSDKGDALQQYRCTLRHSYASHVSRVVICITTRLRHETSIYIALSTPAPLPRSVPPMTFRRAFSQSTGQYLVFPLYVWNMAFVVISCAMSPWVFNTGIFWLTLLPTSVLLGSSVLAELVMTGFRVSWLAVSEMCCCCPGLCPGVVSGSSCGWMGFVSWDVFVCKPFFNYCLFFSSDASLSSTSRLLPALLPRAPPPPTPDQSRLLYACCTVQPRAPRSWSTRSLQILAVMLTSPCNHGELGKAYTHTVKYQILSLIFSSRFLYLHTKNIGVNISVLVCFAFNT